jgi:hypothetical protein
MRSCDFATYGARKYTTTSIPMTTNEDQGTRNYLVQGTSNYLVAGLEVATQGEEYSA